MQTLENGIYFGREGVASRLSQRVWLPDPDKGEYKPFYSTEGDMIIVAHTTGRADIIARSTCGAHIVRVAVRVEEDFDLPRGVESRRHELYDRWNYLYHL